MNIKRIMLITFLLLAVLTIGAVSASDDVAADNLTVSDDADIIEYEYDETEEDDYYFDPTVDEEISLDLDDDDITYIYLPSEAKGYVELSTDKGIIIKLDVDIDDDHWEEDEDGLTGTITIGDIFNNLNMIENGGNLTFKYYEIKNQKPELIDMFTLVCKVTLTESTMKLTEIDGEYEFEDIEVEYPIDFDEGVIMEDDWGETELIQITVNNENLEGRFEIWINKTLKFNKTLDSLDGDSDVYNIYLKDLNINKAGTYLIESYFYDNAGIVKYNSTDEETEEIILTLYEPQTADIDNVNITVNPRPTVITGNESFITINSAASADDNITVYVDDEEPITIKLNNTRRDEYDNYIIGSKELNIILKVGEHNINITYKGKNITDKKINLISNIVITLEKDTVYTGFDDEGFVFITLEEGDIQEAQIEGKINITIMDDAENIIATYQEYIDDIANSPDEDEDFRIIKTEDLKNPTLNGTYRVIVRYFDGDEAETQTEGKVTFKTVIAEDFEARITEIIKDKNDSAITFKNLPLIDNIRVEINGTKVEESQYIKAFYEQEGEYYIKFDKLEGLTDGVHKISVFLEKNYMKYIELASAEVFVDVEENINPDLTITVSNIEEGNTANVVITTNTTFSGNVTVKVANKNYTVNVDKGHGGIPITGLKANTYTATVFFKSDGIFNDSVKSTTFKVTSKTYIPPRKVSVIKLTLKKVKVKKSAKKLVLKATLKIDGKPPKKGTKIIFTFKGKKYTGKTNAKGVAKVTIKKKVLKKLKVGKKVKYTAKYSIKTVKKTVKVKK